MTADDEQIGTTSLGGIGGTPIWEAAMRHRPLLQRDCANLPFGHMKFLSGSLILLLLLHLQCGGSCRKPATKTPPPCHKQENSPPSQPQSSHEADGPCNQGQLIESKTFHSGKVALELAAVLPLSLAAAMASDLRLPTITPGIASVASPPPVPISVLRI
jgi:hypothetical protein